MGTQAVSFVVKGEMDLASIYTLLAGKFSVQVEPKQRFSRTWLDSFDWRLYAGGGMLVLQKGNVSQLVWQAFDDSVSEQLPWNGAAPVMPAELEPCALKDHIVPLLEMRALLPTVGLQGEIQQFRILDGERKTVCRVFVEESKASVPGSSQRASMPARLTVQPVRGYWQDHDRQVAFLDKQKFLVREERPALVRALQAIGRQPADYSSKLDVEMKPGERADVVAKRIHSHLLHTLEVNIAGTKADIDSEFLHDLRVAVRRTRSALTQIKGVFAEEVVERFKEGFAWVGQVTGPTRDMDVYLLGFEDYQNSLPAVARPDLEPFRDYLVRHHKTEQEALKRKLGSPHFHKLLKEWRAFLDEPVEKHPQAKSAAKPVEKVASKRIWRMYQRVMEEGSAINDDTEAEALHELRKSCKKLRYLMEFYQELYPQGELKRLIKALKKLLDNLGNFQDLEVQAERLHHMADQMVEEGETPTGTLLAMGMLMTGLYERQQQAREEFNSIFARFADGKIGNSYQALFNS